MTEIEKMWIPMSERKPTWDDFPDETECYVLSDRWDSKHGFVPRVYFAIWTGEHFILERTFGVPIDRVTHWMPPPKAPTQEQMLLGEETWNPAKAAPTMNGVQWIPVTERLPENEVDVLILAERRLYGIPETDGRKRYIVAAAFHTDGKMNTEDSGYNWELWDTGAEYDEEADAYIIPEGWWEAVRYGEEFSAVDDFVTHWMPLPEPPKEEP